LRDIQRQSSVHVSHSNAPCSRYLKPVSSITAVDAREFNQSPAPDSSPRLGCTQRSLRVSFIIWPTVDIMRRSGDALRLSNDHFGRTQVVHSAKRKSFALCTSAKKRMPSAIDHAHSTAPLSCGDSLDHDAIKLNRDHGLAFCLSMIFSENRFHFSGSCSSVCDVGVMESVASRSPAARSLAEPDW